MKNVLHLRIAVNEGPNNKNPGECQKEHVLTKSGKYAETKTIKRDVAERLLESYYSTFGLSGGGPQGWNILSSRLNLTRALDSFSAIAM